MILHNWAFVPAFSACMWGNVSGNPKFRDGHHIRTSAVVGADPVAGTFTTKSGSVYELGTPDPAMSKDNPNMREDFFNYWSKKMESKPKALVVLSGGQDSTTCLYWAIAQGYEVHAITFDYGQRHKIEIESAIRIARMAGVVTHEVIEMGDTILAGTSPLTNKAVELEQYADHQSLPGGLEKTFVPMRNQLFLTVAANRAYVLGCNVLVTGVCQEDSGGYPDCRLTFIDALQEACNYGTFTGEPGTLPPLRIKTPLMHLTKADSVRLAQRLPGCMEALAYSHTSYDGAYPPVGKDHATLLRAKGFEEAGVADPLVVRAYNEGLMQLPESSNYDQLRKDFEDVRRQESE